MMIPTLTTPKSNKPNNRIHKTQANLFLDHKHRYEQHNHHLHKQYNDIDLNRSANTKLKKIIKIDE